MMTKAGHHLTGFITAGLLYAAMPSIPVFAMAACVIGATAPDWLEIPCHINGKRYSLIPHRTITHWVVLWVALLVYGATRSNELLGAIVLGFSAGGLTHLAFDIPNPTGVPVLNPVKNTSLNLWRSGNVEWLLVPGYASVVLLLFILRGLI